jgi:AcrR family transcriptional regulator
MNPDSATRKKPQKLKERLRDVTSATILQAAEEVLVEKGLEAPMEVIAARAGVAVGTLYNHFKDRRALVEALLEEHRAQAGKAVEEAAAATKGQPVRARLLAMVSAMSSRVARMVLLLRETDKPMSHRRGATKSRTSEHFEAVLARAQRDGELVKDDVVLQTAALQSLMRGLFWFSAQEPARLKVAHIAERVVDTFLLGAAPRSSR